MEYQAHCHCGRVRFSFRGPEITAAMRCDCSLCVRRGVLLSWTYVPAKDFTPHGNPEDLDVYRWNEKILSNYFCKNCGIFVYVQDGENGYRLNLGCVEGIDALALPVTIVHGKSLPIINPPRAG